MKAASFDFREANNDARAAAYAIGLLLSDSYEDARSVRALAITGAAADNASAAKYGLEVQFYGYQIRFDDVDGQDQDL